MNTKKTTTYDVGNPAPGLGKAHTCGRVKPANGMYLSNTQKPWFTKIHH